MSTTTVSAQGDQRTPEESEAELPTEESVRSWDCEELYTWLSSIRPPPLSPYRASIDKFVKLEMDGQVFLNGTFAYFVEDCKLSVGVAKRLCLISGDIKQGTILIRTPQKRLRSSGDEGDHSPKKMAFSATSHSDSQKVLIEKVSKLDGAAVNELDGWQYSFTLFVCSV